MSPSTSDTRTRFTATGPHASSKSPSSTSYPPIGSYQPPTPGPNRISSTPPGPPNESPQEKVARLRAASRLAKAKASMSPLDRVIEHGRRVADKSHRIVAYGLIGFTGLATLVSLYGAFDFIRHNRRQKRAWIERELQRLHDARQAFLRGNPTPEQLHLLEQERAGDEILEQARRVTERKQRESWWGKGKAALGLGMSDAVEGEDVGRYGRAKRRGDTEEVLPGERLLDEERWTGDRNSGKSVTEAVRDMMDGKRKGGEKEVERVTGLHGGPLDVLAQNATQAARERTAGSRRWLSWGRPENDQ